MENFMDFLSKKKTLLFFADVSFCPCRLRRCFWRAWNFPALNLEYFQYSFLYNGAPAF
ncbi:MAG: hypothetical protein IJP90_14425 [Treponema sp.]|nr:hypothetical protein [Treponema sp.]